MMLVNRLCASPPHAVVLESRALRWMWHGVSGPLTRPLTTAMYWNHVTNPLFYLLVWGGGLIAWGAVFWSLRNRGGPILFFERHVAPGWGASILAPIGLFDSERRPNLPVRPLSPSLGGV